LQNVCRYRYDIAGIADAAAAVCTRYYIIIHCARCSLRKVFSLLLLYFYIVTIIYYLFSFFFFFFTGTMPIG
jgi:hypothetical protein